MHVFLFRCPQTGLNVQAHLSAHEVPQQTYVAQHCLACGGVHLVNPRTGRLMSEEASAEKRPGSRPAGR